MGFSSYGIIITKSNRRLIRRQKAFELWIVDGKSSTDKKTQSTNRNPILSPAKKRAFKMRMARAKKNGIWHEVKMYLVSFFIVVMCFIIFQWFL